MSNILCKHSVDCKNNSLKSKQKKVMYLLVSTDQKNTSCTFWTGTLHHYNSRYLSFQQHKWRQTLTTILPSRCYLQLSNYKRNASSDESSTLIYCGWQAYSIMEVLLTIYFLYQRTTSKINQNVTGQWNVNSHCFANTTYENCQSVHLGIIEN